MDAVVGKLADPPVLSVLASHLSGRSPFWTSLNLGAYAGAQLAGRVCLVDLDLNRYIETLLPRALNTTGGLDRVLASEVNLFRHDDAAATMLAQCAVAVPGVAAQVVPGPSLGDLRVDSGVFADRWRRVLDTYRWAIRTARRAGLLVVVMPPENPKLLATWVANRLVSAAAQGPYGPADYARLPQEAHDLAVSLTEDLWELAVTEATCALFVVEERSRHLQPLADSGERWRPERGGWVLACATTCDHHGHTSLVHDGHLGAMTQAHGPSQAADAAEVAGTEGGGRFPLVGSLSYPGDREQRTDGLLWGSATTGDARGVQTQLDRILHEATASGRGVDEESWWTQVFQLAVPASAVRDSSHAHEPQRSEATTGGRRWWRGRG